MGTTKRMTMNNVQLNHIRLTSNPPVVKAENALPTALVFVDVEGRDIGTYVRQSQEVVSREVKVPPGCHLQWLGQVAVTTESSSSHLSSKQGRLDRCQRS